MTLLKNSSKYKSQMDLAIKCYKKWTGQYEIIKESYVNIASVFVTDVTITLRWEVDKYIKFLPTEGQLWDYKKRKQHYNYEFSPTKIGFKPAFGSFWTHIVRLT